MNKILYRVWDKKCNVMRPVVRLEGDPGTGEMYGVLVGAKNEHLKEVVLMQYIGLNDKNGKEIYEGDVLALDNERFKVRWSQQLAAFMVEPLTSEARQRGELKYVNDLFAFTEKTTEFEVVGNIYENADLDRRMK